MKTHHREMETGYGSEKKVFAGILSKVLTTAALLCACTMTAQQVYDDNEEVSLVKYITRPEGRVEQFAENPAPDSVNPSSHCSKFARNRQRYDYIKILPSHKLDGVESFASYDPAAPRLRMKVFTTAPAGSVVELQLGKQNANAYPEGTHSQYQAVIKKSGVWQDLEFKFVETPKGSETGARQVDQVTLLFMPNSTANFVFYFDELRGPDIQEIAATKIFRKKQGIQKRQ